MANVYIALGSNVGPRWATLDAAIARLRREPGIRVIQTSSYYETAPVGGPSGQGAYLNAAAEIETERTPESILQLLLTIEQSLGRIRTVKDAPRTLDLDILLYNDVILNDSDLILPHPRMHERAFVLGPLKEIAPHAIHPILKTSIFTLASQVGPLPTATARPPANHPGRLANMTALVTGSTSGIGFAVAQALRAEGARVVTHGRRAMPGEHIRADLNLSQDVDRLAEEAWTMTGGLDILACLAGADTLTGEDSKASFETKLDWLLNVDLKATMRLSRTLGVRMKARNRGTILTMGWDQAETGMEGDSGQLFAAVKGAIMAYTRSLAKTLSPQVRVNCLAPGWIRTAWGETASATWQERVRRETPLGVWGLPEDIANAAVWLADPASAFVTGQTIRINGGVV